MPSKIAISVPVLLKGLVAGNELGMIFAMSPAGLDVALLYGAFLFACF